MNGEESMISIARLLLFFVITMGYNAFFRNTVKMNRSLTWCLLFSVITLVLYLGSLLGFMLQTVCHFCFGLSFESLLSLGGMEKEISL